MRGLPKGMGVEFSDNSTTQSNVTLLAASINALPETASEGAIAATLSIIGNDYVAPASYIIISDPSGFFEIVDNELLVKSGATFDYETTQSYPVFIEGTDAAPNTYSKTVDVPITNINEAPTDISLSATGTSEATEIGDTIATISSSGDPDAGDTATYSIISDPDNKFLISGTDLKLNGALDYATDTSHDVTIRVTDSGSLFYDEAFVIDVEESSGLWLNTMLPNVIAGYDGFRQVVGDGDVPTWTDYSGGGNDATQISGGSQPRVGDDQIGGLNVLTFDGASDFLNLPAALLALSSGNNTFMGLFEPDDLLTSHRIFSMGPVATSRFFLLLQGSSLRFNCGVSFGNSAKAEIPTGPVIVTALRNGTTQSISINGATPVTNGNGADIVSTEGTLGSTSSGGGAFFAGKQAQLMFCNAALGLSNIQKAEGRLAHKWGVQSILDIAHPYKINPPMV